MSEQKDLAKSLALALELIKLQQGEIQALKLALRALRDSVALDKAPLSFDDAYRQVLEENRENLRNDDEVRRLLNEHLQKVRSLAKLPPKE
jgi:hypothetical protein